MSIAAGPIPHKIFLAGEWVDSPEPLFVGNPADPSTPAGATYLATPEQYERAVQAAVAAFEVTRKLPAYERGAILRNLSAGIKARREELATLLSREAGKPIRDAYVEVDRAARFLKGSGLPVRIPVIEMVEIGAGGGSIARLDALNERGLGEHLCKIARYAIDDGRWQTRWTDQARPADRFEPGQPGDRQFGERQGSYGPGGGGGHAPIVPPDTQGVRATHDPARMQFTERARDAFIT